MRQVLSFFSINMSSLFSLSLSLICHTIISTSITKQTKHRYVYIYVCVCIAWQESDADTKISASQFPFSFVTKRCSFCVFSYHTISSSYLVYFYCNSVSFYFFIKFSFVLICIVSLFVSMFIPSSIAGIISIQEVSSSNWILQSYIQLCHWYYAYRYPSNVE